MNVVVVFVVTATALISPVRSVELLDGQERASGLTVRVVTVTNRDKSGTTGVTFARCDPQVIEESVLVDHGSLVTV